MFFKSKSFIGVDIGAGGVKMVELRKEKGRPVLFTYALTSERHDVHNLSYHQSIVADKKSSLIDLETIKEKSDAVLDIKEGNDQEKIKEYSEKIRKLHLASRAMSKSAVVSLPVSSIFHAIVTLPIVKKKDELDRLLKAEVKKFISFSLEDLALDYQLLGIDQKEGVQRILINAVPNVIIKFYTEIFKKAGMVLEALEPESTALTRSLVGRDTAVSMIVDIGAERTNFFIIDQSIPITHQSIETGGDKIDKIIQNIIGLDKEIVEQAKVDLFGYLGSNRNDLPGIDQKKFLDIFIPMVDPIIKEIEISFELYLRQTGNESKKPEKVILSGGSALLPFLADYISDRFKLKCFVGDPWARVVYQDSLKPILSRIGPRMSVAIGLALRNMV